MGQTSIHPAAERWINSTLRSTANARATRSDSSFSDNLADYIRSRRREDPSSGREGPKRTTLRSTSDSDSANPPPRRPPHKEKLRHLRHRIYNSPHRDDSDFPPFSPPISRRRTSTPTSIPCDFAASTKAPPSTSSLIETITAETIAAMERHLATLGLLPRSVDALDVETSASVAPPPAAVLVMSRVLPRPLCPLCRAL